MEPIYKYLFIDIETAPLEKEFTDISRGLQSLWVDKARKKGYMQEECDNPALIFKDKAAVFAEFGRIVCIGIGCFLKREDKLYFTVKSINGNGRKTFVKCVLQSDRYVYEAYSAPCLLRS